MDVTSLTENWEPFVCVRVRMYVSEGAKPTITLSGSYVQWADYIQYVPPQKVIQ